MPIDVVIVGGGIAGLAAAYELKTKSSTTEATEFGHSQSEVTVFRFTK